MKRSRLVRKHAMRRTKFMVKKLKERSAERGGDQKYLEWVRSLECCVCSALPPSHPHHATLTGRGKGQKSSDRETMPMCFRCHRAFHDGKWYFEYWTREKRRIWQEAQVARLQDLFRYFGYPTELPKAPRAGSDDTIL